MADIISGIPHLLGANPTQLIVSGEPFLVLGGEVHNSSSSSRAYMADKWDRLAALNLNTILAPLSWELIEPVEGEFDFTTVDFLIDDCRAHGFKWIPLWFGTWKNAWSTYAPEWVKTDLRRFVRTETPRGFRVGNVSNLSDEACAADSRAFAATMAHIRQRDGADHTVIMVQVENEPGLLGDSRDRSDAAERVFRGGVAPELLAALSARRDSLHPYLAANRDLHQWRESGDWKDVFGQDADEIFMAWHTALFVGRVASAGRAEYDLPMFANAWLAQHAGEPAGRFPSGGPVSRMIDIWRAAAPALDLLAPDIYVEDFAGVCGEYHRANNPLLIPEARNDQSMAPKALFAVGQHDAIGFSPFGIDSVGAAGEADILGGPAADASFTIKTDATGALLSDTYRLMAGMAPQILDAQRRRMIRGILQSSDVPQVLYMEGYRITVTFNRPMSADHAVAGGLLIRTEPDSFLVAGFGFRAVFDSADGNETRVEYLEHWDGDFADGAWTPGRRLNGDEMDLRMTERLSVRKLKFFRCPVA